MKKCNELRLKLQEIKTLKKEFDLELERVRERWDTSIALEMKNRIESMCSEIEKVADPFHITARKRIGEMHGAKYIGDFQKGVAIMELDYKEKCLVDKKGEKLTGIFADLKRAGDDRYLAKIDGDNDSRAHYLLNEKGGIIRPMKIRGIGIFEEGFASVEINGGEYSFIGRNGEFLSKETYESTYGFSEGLASVRIKNNNKYEWIAIDKTGKCIFSDDYGHLDSFSDGFARVHTKDGKWFFIDHQGRKHFKGFDAVWKFSEGLARVEKNGKQFFIDTSGKMLTQLEFNKCDEFKEGFARVADENGWTFINKKGDLLTTIHFDEVCNFRNGFARVKIKSKFGAGEWTFIDSDGEFITKETFGDNSLGDFNDVYASARKDGKAFYLDTAGNHHFEDMFNDTYGFEDGLAAVKMKDDDNRMGYAYIDRRGKVVFRNK